MTIKKLTAEGIFECGLEDATRGKLCALVPVHTRHGLGLGVAVANQPGYFAVPLYWCHGDDHEEMRVHADELNRSLFGLDESTALMVVSSTMTEQFLRSQGAGLSELTP